MSRQIEQALLSLVPTLSSDLPPSLTELAGSLLAQSRLKASTLKADEEVARLYACAHLACDRLKITLDLPPIQPRPPIPPRIYKRLYSHLDNVIPQSTTPARSRSGRVRMPSGKALGEGMYDDRPLPSRGTPTKDQSLAQWRTPTKGGDGVGTPTSLNRRLALGTGTHLRPWVMPVIRYLCAQENQPKLLSTMVAGMDAITTQGGKPARDEWINENYTALFAAVFYWTLARATAISRGQEVARQPSLQRRREVLSLLTQARKTVEVTTLGDGHPWEGWADLKPRDLHNAVAMVEQRSWLGDWWGGIDDVVRSSDWDDMETTNADDAELAAPIRIRRADTMFQDKYDYLSDARQAEYKAWKADIMARLAQQKENSSAMEIDTQ